MCSKTIPFGTIAKGEDSGFCVSKELTIDNEAQWMEVWRKHSAILSSPLSAPIIDFNSKTVIAIFLGQRTSSGYSVEVESVCINGLLFVVTIHRRRPTPGTPVMDMLSCPYHIISIPRRQNTPVTFDLHD